MSWTYSGDPSTSSRDEIRFLVGDTDSTDQLIENEEIDYVLVVHADPGASQNNYTAASVVAGAIAAKYAKKMNKSVGGLSLPWQQRFESYQRLAQELSAMAKHGPTGKRPQSLGSPVLLGGGDKYLGTDDTPLSYTDSDVDIVYEEG